MERNSLIVGTKQCPLQTVSSILMKCSITKSKWSYIATLLGVSGEAISKSRQDLILDKVNKEDVIYNMVLTWFAANGNKSRLETIIKILEDEVGAFKTSELLRLEFNLPCKLAVDGIAMWSNLSNHYKEKIETNITKFWPFLLSDKDSQANYAVNHTKFLFVKKLKHEQLIDLMTGKKPTIFKCTLPEKLSYYIGRNLLTRNILSNRIFELDCQDIFLFTGMERSQLSKLAQRKSTSTTHEQLNSSLITARFLMLDSTRDFAKISEKVNVPVHWIDYSEGKLQWRKLQWRKSVGEISTLQKCMDTNTQNRLSESNLVNTELNSTLPICISDSPGMGKTFLLAELGRELEKVGNGNADVFFISVNQFIVQLKSLKGDTLEKVKLALNSIVCDNELGDVILRIKLTSAKKEIELLLDGFDEVQESDSERAIELLRIINTSFKSVRLWVTTRPHLLERVENSLNVLGYNIEAFNEDDQINFMTKYWVQFTNLSAVLFQDSFMKYAEFVLKHVKSKINSVEEDIAGIPLQCLLLVEVFQEEALDFVTSIDSNLTLLKVDFDSIANLFKHFIVRKFEKYIKLHVSNTFAGMQELRNMHQFLSLKLLHPEYSEKLKHYFGQFNQNEVLKVGIVSFNVSDDSIHFPHRTFAEYFLANFITDLLFEEGQLEEAVDFVLTNVLGTVRKYSVHILEDIDIELHEFLNNVTCYFLNSILSYQHSHPFVENSTEKLFETRISLMKKYILRASVNHSYLSIFKYFSNDLSCVQEESLILAMVYKSHLDFIKFLLIKLNEENVSLELKLKSLRVAVARGNYSIVEFTIKEIGLLEFVEKLRVNDFPQLLHDCVCNTLGSSEGDIQQKIQICKLLIEINPLLLKQRDQTGRSPMLCLTTHPQLLIGLIHLGGNVLERGKNGETILHFNSDNYSYFVRGGGPITSQDYYQLLENIGDENLKILVHAQETFDYGDTPLLSLIQMGGILTDDILQAFHNAGADFNFKNFENDLPLGEAILQGRDINTIRNLIKYGADAKWRYDNGRSYLHLAAEHGKELVVSFLIREIGMDPNLRDKWGQTPLDLAILSDENMDQLLRYDTGLALHNLGGKLSDDVRFNPKVIVEALKGENLDSVMLSHFLGMFTTAPPTLPFHNVAEACVGADNGIRIILFLLEKEAGGDVFAVDEKGLTFLHHLSSNCLLSTFQFYIVVEDLIRRKYESLFNIHGGESDTTPFQLAVMNFELEEEEGTLELLYLNGADFNAVDKDGDTPLFYAVNGQRSVTILASLVKYGADWKHKNNNKCSILHIAAQNGTLEAFRYFIELKGLDINAIDNDGDTPLHCAVLEGIEDDDNDEDDADDNDEGDSEGDDDKCGYIIEKVNLLVQSGACPHIRNNVELTPLQVAIKRLDISEHVKINLELILQQ